MIEVIPCGTEVTIKMGKIQGIISAISIRYAAYAYEITYYNDGEYKTVWCNEKEFTPGPHEKLQIGFNKQS